LILKIKELLHEKRFTIEGAKRELKEEKKEDKFSFDLIWLRKEIEEIMELLD